MSQAREIPAAQDELEDVEQYNKQFFDKANRSKLKNKPICDILMWEPRLRPLYVCLLCFFFGVLLPMLINHFIPLGKQELDSHRTCILKPEFRYECVPGNDELTEDECKTLHCCWRSNLDDLRAPRCFHSMPSEYGYRVVSSDASGRYQLKDSITIAPILERTPFKTLSAKLLKLTVQSISETHLNIKIYDPTKHIISPFTSNVRTGYFSVVFDHKKNDRVGVRVYRSSTSEKIFDTKYKTFIFSEDYLEISNMLPTSYIYGLGQGQYDTLQRNLDFRKWAIFNSDSSFQSRKQGSHPFYMCIEKSGFVHGVYLQNSYPMEVQLVPSPAIVYRILGGYFDFHIFIGPSPRDVMDQYTKHIGRPSLPPYWSLGYHLCRDTGKEVIFETENEAMDRRSISFDSDCIDEQLLGKLSFTLDTQLFTNITKHIQRLRSRGRKLFFSQFSQVAAVADYPPYSSGVVDQLFVTRSNGSLFTGTFKHETVVYPDFSDSNSLPWLSTHYKTLTEEMRDPFDGLTLINNAPFNEQDGTPPFCKDESFSYLPSEFYESPSNGTICMNATQFNNSKHIEMHNLYGQQHHKKVFDVLNKAFPLRRTLVMSESTYPGSGKYGGFFGGDYTADWWQMKHSLIQILEYGLYGIPLSGVPICGSLDTKFIFPNETKLYEELCLRWHQLGSFYPFARNIFKSEQHPRSPTHFTKHFSKWVNIYIGQRYSLLPYYYTLLYHSHKHGTPVLRPLFFEFPFDDNVYSIDEQFMVGSVLLVSPVLYPGKREIQAYFPKCVWYDFKMGALARHNATSFFSGQWGLLQALEDEINVHMRGGSIITALTPAETAERTREKKYTLITALDCQPGKTVCASGELYMDDGISQTSLEDGDYYYLHFSATEHSVLIDRTNGETLCSKNCTLSTVINFVRVYGVNKEPYKISVSKDGEEVDTQAQVHYEEDISVLSVLSVEIDWCKGKTFAVMW